jgi:hypothetical protein
MNSQGTALYCSNCTYTRDGMLLHQVLGSITGDGILLIKRAHNAHTLLKVHQFTILCQCGYELSVTIKSPGLKQTDYLYEQI